MSRLLDNNPLKAKVQYSRNKAKRAIKSPVQRKIPRKRLSALRSFITNSNPNQYFWRSHANTLGAALGRLVKLGNPVRTGKQFCPNPTEVHRIAPVNGHGVKLVGETGEV